MTSRIEAAELELARAILEKEGDITIFKLVISVSDKAECPVVNVKYLDENGLKTNGITYKKDKLKNYEIHMGDTINAKINTPFGDYNLNITRTR